MRVGGQVPDFAAVRGRYGGWYVSTPLPSYNLSERTMHHKVCILCGSTCCVVLQECEIASGKGIGAAVIVAE